MYTSLLSCYFYCLLAAEISASEQESGKLLSTTVQSSPVTLNAPYSRLLTTSTTNDITSITTSTNTDATASK